MPILRRFRGFFTMIRSYMLLGFEIGMCIVSYRAAYILISDQFYFDKNEHPFAWVVSLISSEWVWGLLALIAATLKTVGLLGFLSKSEEMTEYAFMVRGAGWACSSVLWTMFGISFMRWNDWQIGSGNTLMLGIFSLGMVLAGPVFPPEAKDDR